MEGVPSYPPALKRKYQQRGWWLGRTIVQAFDRACDIYPEKEAVVEGQNRLTFSQLREKTVQAAKAFTSLGIGNGDCVLLQVPNFAEAVYIYLGLKRVGAVPVMCLPRHGQRELERFCTLTQAKAWIGAASFGKTDYVPMIKAMREGFPSLEHAVIVRSEAPAGMVSFSQLMEDSEKGGRLSKLKYATPADPDDIIHLSPTGGTTGLPKLVPKSHNNHLSKSFYFASTLELGARDVNLTFSPLNHDAIHLLNFSLMALMGQRMVMCPSTKVDDILENMAREKVTFTFFVPALLTDFVNADLGKYDLSSLRTVNTGGAHCPAELAKLALRKLREMKCRFHNCYGMTEGAGTATRPGDPEEAVTWTVGKSICPYDEYRAVDESGAVAPSGQEGELATKGPCIVSGYYKSEEENQKVFTSDGFFRTGDLVRFDKYGNMIITGRKKDVINRGGEKVSAYEVEEMLHAHPAVLRAAVLGMPDPRLGERICAYVQPRDNQTLAPSDILAFLKEKGASLLLLPERVEIVSSLPVTAMDKLDKQKLREDITRKLRAEGKIA
ncbi:MAG: AMP-binding protein [Chloroflexi bacterium]|nr:AMP-binding protein [Chloroflexota bacterium]